MVVTHVTGLIFATYEKGKSMKKKTSLGMLWQWTQPVKNRKMDNLLQI